MLIWKLIPGPGIFADVINPGEIDCFCGCVMDFMMFLVYFQDNNQDIITLVEWAGNWFTSVECQGRAAAFCDCQCFLGQPAFCWVGWMLSVLFG